MIIAPGVEQPSVAEMIEIMRTNSLRNVSVTIQSDAGAATDISETMRGGNPVGELDLEITDVDGNVITTETYWPRPVPDDRRITHPTTGKYCLKYGNGSQESDEVGVRLFNWHARVDESSDDIYRTQVVEVVSPKVLSIIPSFRFLIDRCVKPILPEENCFIGYTEGQLIICLKLGIAEINAYQPYPVFTSVDDFPLNTHSSILLKAALYQGIVSSLIFSVDTDIINYSDQGHSFVLQHAPQLQQLMASLKAELDKIVPAFKLQLVDGGSLGLEMKMNAASWLTFQAAPFGSLFRGLWARL